MYIDHLCSAITGLRGTPLWVVDKLDFVDRLRLARLRSSSRARRWQIVPVLLIVAALQTWSFVTHLYIYSLPELTALQVVIAVWDGIGSGLLLFGGGIWLMCTGDTDDFISRRCARRLSRHLGDRIIDIQKSHVFGMMKFDGVSTPVWLENHPQYKQNIDALLTSKPILEISYHIRQLRTLPKPTATDGERIREYTAHLQQIVDEVVDGFKLIEAQESDATRRQADAYLAQLRAFTASTRSVHEDAA